MTRDEIIEMARQAGMRLDKHNGGFVDASEIKRFAKLVAAKEREALNQLIDSIKQDAETGLVIHDEEGMADALETILTRTCEHLGIGR
jgi:hypothetical protein